MKVEYSDRVKERLKLWHNQFFIHRLFEMDPTLWSPTPLPEITDRLGWLTLPETTSKELDELHTFSREVKAEDISHVVLLGMGGSSLAPEVFMHTFKNAPGYPELTVLDSTHPMAVKSVESQIRLKNTLFLISSKSGTTIETLSLFQYFWQSAKEVIDSPGRHFVAITDPETPLERLARKRGFRQVFLAPPDVGGRFSALSVFGLLPAALIGVDIHRLLREALLMKKRCSSSTTGEENPCLSLGATLGEFAQQGVDKITFFTSPSLDALPYWLEQLIAESTGKDGKGIVPVIDEPIGSPEVYGEDRLFAYIFLEGDDTSSIDEGLKALEEAGNPVVRIKLTDKSEIGQEIFRWEVAVAAAGSILGIHPFDQPDVEIAKRLAREVMDRDVKEGSGHPFSSIENKEGLKGALNALFEGVKASDYIALQAYLAPAQHITELLQKVRIVLRNHLKTATTLGFGPRYLHSTGQLHKGGKNSGIFLQLIDEPEEDLPIPETDYTFKTLIQAQAFGDYQALEQRGRRVIRINLREDAGKGISLLMETLESLVYSS